MFGGSIKIRLEDSIELLFTLFLLSALEAFRVKFKAARSMARMKRIWGILLHLFEIARLV
jgi:hypothetical protein